MLGRFANLSGHNNFAGRGGICNQFDQLHQAYWCMVTRRTSAPYCSRVLHWTSLTFQFVSFHNQSSKQQTCCQAAVCKFRDTCFHMQELLNTPTRAKRRRTDMTAHIQNHGILDMSISSHHLIGNHPDHYSNSLETHKANMKLIIAACGSILPLNHHLQPWMSNVATVALSITCFRGR